MSSYSEQELADIQGRWSLRFPPDLLDLYRQRRSVIPGGFDWLDTPAAYIQAMLDWPLEGLLFDLKENELWFDDWGERPTDMATAQDAVRAAVAEAPRLIPLFGHRYIPETPHAAGNPVLSVYQSDIIYYGMDLAQYVANETGQWSPPTRPPRAIQFWSRFLDD